MSKLDRLIEESLKAEDRAIYAQHGEQGLAGMVGGMFSGKLGWWVAISMIAQIALFAGAFYAAAKFFTVDDVTMMIRWGMIASVWFMAVATIKIMHWSQMQANRVIREIKRLELQIARSA